MLSTLFFFFLINVWRHNYYISIDINDVFKPFAACYLSTTGRNKAFFFFFNIIIAINHLSTATLHIQTTCFWHNSTELVIMIIKIMLLAVTFKW